MSITINDVLSIDRDYLLWLMLTRTREAILEVRQKELHENNVETRHSAVLFAVKMLGNEATPSEIGRWLFRRSHSVSELLSKMEKRGLLYRVKDLKRKNQVRVVLTDKGNAAYNRSSRRESIHKIMSCLSEEERKQLWSALQKLREDALREIRRPTPFPPSLDT